MQNVRQVGLCGLCDEPLTPAEKALGFAFCDDCVNGRQKAHPAKRKRKSRAWKVLGNVAFALLCAAAMGSLYMAAHLMERGA